MRAGAYGFSAHREDGPGRPIEGLERSAEQRAEGEYQHVLEGIVARLAREEKQLETAAAARTRPLPRGVQPRKTMREVLEADLDRALVPNSEISGPARQRLVGMGIPSTWSSEQLAMLKSSIPWMLEMYKKAQAQSQFESGMAAAGAEQGAAAATNRDLGALIRATEEGAGPSPKRSAGYSDARAKFEALFGGAPAESGDAAAAGEHADR